LGLKLNPFCPTATVWMELEELAVVVAATEDEDEDVVLPPPPLPYCANADGTMRRMADRNFILRLIGELEEELECTEHTL